LLKRTKNIKLNEAAISGNIKCLKYAFKINAQRDEYTLSYAAASRNVTCLKYVHRVIGCSKTKTTNMLASASSYACLKYAFEVIGAKDIYGETLGNVAYYGNLKFRRQNYKEFLSQHNFLYFSYCKSF
jgi:hypothetical protein